MTIKTLLIILGLCVPFFLLTILALVDLAQREYDPPRKKVIWWVVASIPFVGFIPYLLFGLRQGKKI